MEPKFHDTICFGWGPGVCQGLIKKNGADHYLFTFGPKAAVPNKYRYHQGPVLGPFILALIPVDKFDKERINA
jgi:hypothetical protein